MPTRPDRLDRLASIAFVVALAVPAIAILLGIRPENLEGRATTTLPPLDVSALGEPSTYATIDRYIADRFPGRNEAVWAQAAIDYGLLGGSTTPDVIVGRDGWLFTRTELEPTCRFEPAEVLAALDRAHAALAAQGIELRLIVPPDKHSIYPEQVVPESGLGRACSDDRRAAMLAGMRERPATAVEVWGRLADAHAADPAVPYYFRQDTHWTPLGAVIATRALVDSLDPDVWDDAEVPIDGMAAYDTDLSRLIGLPAKERVPRLVVRPDVTVEEDVIKTSVDLRSAADIPRYIVAEPAPAVEGRTLIVYDSFLRTNERRIAPWFRESVWVHADDLKRSPQLVADLPAFDTIVVARVERSVYDLDLDALLAPLIAAAR